MVHFSARSDQEQASCVVRNDQVVLGEAKPLAFDQTGRPEKCEEVFLLLFNKGVRAVLIEDFYSWGVENPDNVDFPVAASPECVCSIGADAITGPPPDSLLRFRSLGARAPLSVLFKEKAMGVEIERKFLLANDSWRPHVNRSEPMAQGYLAGAKTIHAGLTQCSVRVRIAGNQAWLNVKSATKGIARDEYEYLIPPEDARRMLADLCAGTVEKVRHHVMVEGVHFEIDEFQGANEGLVMAEVELPSIDASHPTPDWLGKEVSEDGRFYNINLIEHPYGQWPAVNRVG